MSSGDLGRNLLAMARLSDAVEKEEETLKKHRSEVSQLVSQRGLNRSNGPGKGKERDRKRGGNG